MANMVRQVGRSGSSARGLADKRRLSINVLLLVALAVIGLYMVLLRSGLGLVGTIVLIFALKMVMGGIEGRVKHHRKRERHALRGAKGEERMADVLGDLPDGYAVYHDINTGNGDIDHVVLAPDGGVFVIETKAHGGRVSFENGEMLVNGRPPEKNFIGQVLRNAYWVKEEIKRQTGEDVWVNAALVFANAFVEWHRPIKGVHVINRKFVGKFLDENRPRKHNPRLVEQLKL